MIPCEIRTLLVQFIDMYGLDGRCRKADNGNTHALSYVIAQVILLKMATQPPPDISEEASMLYVYVPQGS